MLNKVHQIVTDQIIKQLENGNIPWRKPWGGAENEPKNLISKKEYSGINFFLLSMMNMDSPYFLTFKQAKLCGGRARIINTFLGGHEILEGGAVCCGEKRLCLSLLFFAVSPRPFPSPRRRFASARLPAMSRSTCRRATTARRCP